MSVKKIHVAVRWLRDAGSNPALGANLKFSDMKELGTIITNVLTDMPVGFTIDKYHVCLYPLTLGKMHITAQLVDDLEVDKELLKANPFMEALRLVSAKREQCCRLIAYHTLNTREEILSPSKIKEHQNIISLTDNDGIASLLIIVLTNSKSLTTIIEESGIEEENKRMAKVNAAKYSDNQYIFGGKTIWGSLIDAACERYGWTFEYVVWEISYNNLTLMLKDKITSIYLSEEERNKAHLAGANEKVLSGDNIRDVMEAIRESEAAI